MPGQPADRVSSRAMSSTTRKVACPCRIKGDAARPNSSVWNIRISTASLTPRMRRLARRCIQHEVDHLDGILFIERMESLTSSDQGRGSGPAKENPSHPQGRKALAPSPNEGTTRQGEIIPGHPVRRAPPHSPEIHQRASCKSPNIGIATTYRHLKSLGESQQVVGVDCLGQPPRYEWADGRDKVHFACRSCEKLFALDDTTGDTPARPEGFEIQFRSDAAGSAQPAARPEGTAYTAVYAQIDSCTVRLLYSSSKRFSTLLNIRPLSQFSLPHTRATRYPRHQLGHMAPPSRSSGQQPRTTRLRNQTPRCASPPPSSPSAVATRQPDRAIHIPCFAVRVTGPEHKTLEIFSAENSIPSALARPTLRWWNRSMQ